MADWVEVPKGWKLVAPDFKWGLDSVTEAKKARRKTINSGNAEVVGVLIWNFEEGEGDILIHPTHQPVTNFLGNLSAKDWITDCIGLLEKHLEYIVTLEAENKK